MIEADRLSKHFGTAPSALRAVDNAQFTIRDGDFALIFGRSGSGKTTLLGMLAGLVRPTTGTVRINGKEIGTLSDSALSVLRAKEIGFVFQFSGLIPTITVLENVLLPTLFCHDGPGGRSRALDLLAKVGLSDRIPAYPGTLSGGETKRVAIARALINGPSLLIADEPTGDLDAESEIEVMELFARLNREGITIVMVTHNPDLVPYGSRTFVMNRGVISETGGQGLPAATGSRDTAVPGQKDPP
jgi:putative ABC transport system ATP-binding protein